MKSEKLWTFLVVFLLLSLVFKLPALAAFSITNVTPSQITSSNDILVITASASSLLSNPQYLQGAFTAVGSLTNLFGITQNNGGNWYTYKSSPTASDLSATFYSFSHDNGSWTGQISAKIDSTDSGYVGPGQYNLRLYKYTVSSAGNVSSSYTTWGSPITVTIPSPTPAPTPTTVPTPTKTPTQSPTAKQSSIQVTSATAPPSQSPLRTPVAGDSGKTVVQAILPTAILGETMQGQESTQTPTKQQAKTLGSKGSNLANVLVGVGIVLLAACGVLAFRSYRMRLYGRNQSNQ